MKSGETVLVTAAAGGTGQFAVQVSFEICLHFLIQIPAECVNGLEWEVCQELSA